ncbi:MAG: DMT family transporter [Candidatus Dependentiae bacterium]|nr:DMT family transporter [Candidatus Dependentiae bacterium]
MLLIIIMYALLAGSFSMGKILLNHTSPIFLTGIRMFIAGIILLTYQYFSPREHFKFSTKHLALYAQIIFFGFYLTYILRFWGLRDMASYKAVFLYNISPFSTALYSYLMLNERITKKQIIGLCIGFVGLIPILLTTSKAEQLTGELFFISWQEWAIIVSVFASSYSWILIRKMIHHKNYAPAMINGLCMTAGGTLALITACFIPGSLYITEPITFAGWLIAVIVISNIIGHNMYGHLLKIYTATFISFAGFLSPLFAAFYGWAFLGETITWNFYISSIILFIGLYVFYQDELKNRNLNLLVE